MPDLAGDAWSAAARGELASVKSPKSQSGLNLAGFMPIESRGSVNLRKIEAAFEVADRDGSGMIDQEEFDKVFGMDRRQSSRPYAQVLFEVFDIDGSGGIDFREFVYGMTHFPLPSSPGAFEKFMFQCYVRMDRCPKDKLAATVGESLKLLKPLKSMSKVDYKEQRGELMSMLTALQSAEVPYNLTKDELSDLLGAYPRAMAPAQYIWKSIAQHVSSCRELTKEIDSRIAQPVFNDLERSWRKRTHPGVSIEAATTLARKNSKEGNSGAFAKAGKGVLAMVRMSKAVGGGAVSFPPPKRASVYQMREPHFIEEAAVYNSGVGSRRGSLSMEETRGRAGSRRGSLPAMEEEARGRAGLGGRSSLSAEPALGGGGRGEHTPSPRTVLPDIKGGGSEGSVLGRPTGGQVHVSFKLPEQEPSRARFGRLQSKSWSNDRDSPKAHGLAGGSGGGLVSRAKGFLARLS